MPTPRNLPSVSYNTYFGDVGKVLWFEVSDNYNYFELSFTITLQQTKQTNLQVYNNLTNTIVWENTYPSDANQEEYSDYIRLLHVPTPPDEQPMGLINLPT
jgi:hypothetical protein